MSTSIYALLPVGNSYASNPSRGEPSNTLRVLYFMRRHGGKVSIDQIKDYFVPEYIPDEFQARIVMRKLIDMKAVQQIV